ncbi:alpha/beta hydrolase family protein [Streptomyces sp. SAI-097]
MAMPVLALGGIYYRMVLAQMEGRALDIRDVELEGAGHYLAEECPDEIVRELVKFFA